MGTHLYTITSGNDDEGWESHEANGVDMDETLMDWSGHGVLTGRDEGEVTIKIRLSDDDLGSSFGPHKRTGGRPKKKYRPETS